MTTTHSRAAAGTVTPALADAMVELGALALRFGEIQRTAVYHADRVTPEDDAEHTVMLGWLACALAARCCPTLDIGLVAQYALLHDAAEIYAGDTPTLRIDAAGRAEKAAREHAAVARLHDQFAHRLPWFPAMLANYEAQNTPEARFVRGVDKIMPKIVHLIDGGTGLAEQGVGRAELVDICARQLADMAGYVGEFAAVLDLYGELVARVLDIVGQHHLTLAQTRTGLDWCAGCGVEAGSNRYDDAATGPCCGTCGAPLSAGPAGVHTVPCGLGCGYLADSEADLDHHENHECDNRFAPLPADRASVPSPRPVGSIPRRVARPGQRSGGEQR